MADEAKKDILLIEDDLFLGDALTQKLQHEGYNVHLVRDGGEGLKQMKAEMPHLVLLDIILPTLNGYEILEAKKNDPSIAQIPVIIISNSGQPAEVNRILSLGVKDYLIKASLDPQDVVEKIRPYFQKKLGEDEASHRRLKGKKILCVEDDSFLADLLAMKLNREGCTGLYAKTGEEALKILEKEVPDVIVLDLVLPGMSGYDVLDKVKHIEATKGIPVIVLSNLGQDHDIEKSKQMGAVKHLIKAEHDLDDLVTHIQEVVSK